MRRRVVIIGGGVAGTAAFAALARAGADASVDVVDPLPAGGSPAFAVEDAALLCNTSADLMSLVPRTPGDFGGILSARGVVSDREAFAPRREFARYLRDVHDFWAGRPGAAYRRFARRAVRVERHDDGYRVVLDDGTSLSATDVLVCSGWGPPRVPDGLDRMPGVVPSPFPERRMLESVPPSGNVLVLGTKLSAIDAALLLARHGHRVTMASPSGDLPAVRTRTVRGAVRIDPAEVGRLDPADPRLTRRILALAARTLGLPLSCADASRGTVERLRAEIGLARRGQVGWQDVLVELVDIANPMLLRRDADARRRVHRACGPLMRYLGAFPLCNAERLLALLDSGQVRVRAGAPSRLDGPSRVQWPDGRTERFDTIVCATGFTSRPMHMRHGALVLSDGPSAAPPELDTDLRLRMDGRSERIWLLGISSGFRMPFVNAVHHAADQADAFVQKFAEA
ncbi:FAD/NAD(P)-binding protein [Actinomadura rupiterrae]|uniref:FAD/NAD(P)-binding protein n=1 Tax=Actinomadura rupiterrae TaxID=559627 RepID=UPI0020A3BD06|nr:FAD/NAD(P)-binding protein [Actinomadura rupiterrae]MCP2339003.1 glycine/D-amino acid oxidase-like deaminating enzyme [Actinomadura rupiterrae]